MPGGGPSSGVIRVSALMAGARPETATVVFTDVVGSTSWRVEVGGRRADQRSAELERASRDAVATCGGTVVKALGDGVMATFASAWRRWTRRCRCRCWRDGSRSVESKAVCGSGSAAATWFVKERTGSAPRRSRRARLCAEAAGGSVLVADATVRLSRGSSDHELRPLGRRLLRGFADEIEVYELVAARGDSRGLPAAMTQATADALVGRGAEFGRARSMLDEVAAGAARTMFIVGEPGVGKTRLAAAVAAEAHAEGFIVLHGRCDAGLAAPYQPVIESFGPWLADCPDVALGRVLGPGPRVGPALARSGAAAPGVGVGGGGLRDRPAVTKMAVAGSRRRPGPIRCRRTPPAARGRRLALGRAVHAAHARSCRPAGGAGYRRRGDPSAR